LPGVLSIGVRRRSAATRRPCLRAARSSSERPA